MTLIIVGGYAGAGKTTFSRLLATRTQATFIDKDTLTMPLVEKLCTEMGMSAHDRESEKYLKQVRPLEYACLLASIEDNLACPRAIIAAAPWGESSAPRAGRPPRVNSRLPSATRPP